MQTSFCYRGREFTAAEITALRALIAAHPEWSRRRLSAEWCRQVGWVQPNGQLRDMVARSFMLALHRAGRIALPAPRLRVPNNAITRRRAPAAPGAGAAPAPVTGTLAALGPLVLRSVRRTSEEPLFDALVAAHHYLGYRRPVGEHLKYLVWAGARPVACLAWSSAPRRLNLRDAFIGGPPARSRGNLHLIAYNTRFLILPWVRVPDLASRVLGLLARQIARDWTAAYGHPVHLLETFVEGDRFRSTGYRAANWQCLGRSAGRGTKARPGQPACPVKELWVYPLGADFRQHLLAAHA